MEKTLDLTKMSIKDYISVFLKGILLGLISVGIPGVSASTIGIIIGIYVLMVDSIANIFKDFKHNFPFLIVLILGYGVGAIGAAVSISILYDKFPLITTFAILGFLIGSLPDMLIDLKGGYHKASNWITLIITVAVLIVYNFVIQSRASITFPVEPTIQFLIFMIFIGFITSSTFVIPGIDFALVFLSLGIYYPFTNMIKDLISFTSPTYFDTFLASIEILSFYLVGYLIGIFLMSKLIKLLSEKYQSQFKFASLGFIIASPIIVIKSCIYDNPSFSQGETNRTQLIVALVFFLVGLYLTIKVMAKSRSQQKSKNPDLVDNSLKFEPRIFKTFIFHIPMAINCIISLKRFIKRNNKGEDTFDEAYNFAHKMCVNYAKFEDLNVITSGKEYLSTISKDEGICYISNHQSKNDCLLILGNIENHPASFIINDARSHMIFFKDIVDGLQAKRIKMTDLKSQARVYNQMGEEITKGRSYIIFPEGGYKDNKNDLQYFNTPCFQPIIKSHCKIVPIAIYDIYKSCIPEIKGKLDVQIHFLKPIEYEEYQDKSRAELAELVKHRIEEKINELNKQNNKIDIEFDKISKSIN